MYKFLEDCLPSDNCRQSSAMKAVSPFLPKAALLLDLGCGTGDTYEKFRSANPNLSWIGIDIRDSQEVKSRTLRNGRICSFDGFRLPFRHNQFDLIYSRQVFEHVKYPHDLIKEVGRTLRHGGYFIGSVSQMEPYHSRSMFGYTPYGWRQLLEDAHMTLEEVRPGIDVLTLLLRRALHLSRLWFYESSSPANRLLGIAGRLSGRSVGQINALKLRFAGHFSFRAVKK